MGAGFDRRTVASSSLGDSSRIVLDVKIWILI